MTRGATAACNAGVRCGRAANSRGTVPACFATRATCLLRVPVNLDSGASTRHSACTTCLFSRNFKAGFAGLTAAVGAALRVRTVTTGDGGPIPARLTAGAARAKFVTIGGDPIADTGGPAGATDLVRGFEETGLAGFATAVGTARCEWTVTTGVRGPIPARSAAGAAGAKLVAVDDDPFAGTDGPAGATDLIPRLKETGLAGLATAVGAALRVRVVAAV